MSVVTIQTALTDKQNTICMSPPPPKIWGPKATTKVTLSILKLWCTVNQKNVCLVFRINCVRPNRQPKESFKALRIETSLTDYLSHIAIEALYIPQ